MIWTITNLNVLREIGSEEDGLKNESLQGRDHIRAWWKRTHVERIAKSVAKLLRLGWVWQNENEKLLITKIGKERLKAVKP